MIGALIGALKTALAADVVDENVIEVCPPAAGVVDSFDQPFSALNTQTTTAFVGISADDRKGMLSGIYRDGGSLVLS